jgi:tagatose 6-phosphate kinase
MVFRNLTLDAVNRAVTTVDGVAGKALNVAKALKEFGEHPVLAGFLGGDRGEHLRAVMADRQIEADFVTVEAQTRQCITVIDESAGTHTELVEDGRQVAVAAYEELLSVVRRRVVGCRAVVMSGTIASSGPADLYYTCTRLAEAEGALSVVDAQGSALTEALKAGPGLVKPNVAELAATAGRRLAGEGEVMEAMRELSERGARRVVVTAGKLPALAFDGKVFWRVIPPEIKAVSPIGSGDAFTAALVWRLVGGDDLGEACRWAAAAGAANALTLMSGEFNRADVDRLVREAEVRRI